MGRAKSSSWDLAVLHAREAERQPIEGAPQAWVRGERLQ